MITRFAILDYEHEYEDVCSDSKRDLGVVGMWLDLDSLFEKKKVPVLTALKSTAEPRDHFDVTV